MFTVCPRQGSNGNLVGVLLSWTRTLRGYDDSSVGGGGGGGGAAVRQDEGRG